MVPNFNKAQSFQVKPNTYTSSSYTGNNMGEDEAKQRLMSLGNKKGISSEDIFGAKEEKS